MNNIDFKFNTHKWLVTGAAGFIGSHLVEFLLKNNQIVIGVDNFITGSRLRLDQLSEEIPSTQWENFTFIEGDLRDFSLCQKLTEQIDFVLHQAALGSVPRSLKMPELTHDMNVNGFFNILRASKEAKVKSFVYASSSSVYGDSPTLPKKEEHQGNLLSPYAVTKHINEAYADIFARSYSMKTVGLRYFNVFGPRQSPEGPYAAVIPLWMDAVLNDKEVFINGDGSTSRDFTYVANVVQANIKAALHTPFEQGHRVYNIAAGGQTTLSQLFEIICVSAQKLSTKPIYRDFREGDIRHSNADISNAKNDLQYSPTTSIHEGIQQTWDWFQQNSMLFKQEK